jgi:hypothetical protein
MIRSACRSWKKDPKLTCPSDQDRTQEGVWHLQQGSQNTVGMTDQDDSIEHPGFALH